MSCVSFCNVLDAWLEEGYCLYGNVKYECVIWIHFPKFNHKLVSHACENDIIVYISLQKGTLGFESHSKIA